MSDTDFSLPFSIEFDGGSIGQDHIYGADEEKYRKRIYRLKHFAGKTGYLTLGGLPLVRGRIAEEGEALVLEPVGKESVLQEAMEEETLPLAVSAGQATLDMKGLAELKRGDVITLDRAPNSNLPLEIETDRRYLGYGEIVLIDSSLGIRMTEMCREEIYAPPTGKEGAAIGRVMLGTAYFSPSVLTEIGEGSIINLNAYPDPQILRFADGREIGGYLQAYTRDELNRCPRRINPMPSHGHPLVLAFCVTSPTGAELKAPPVPPQEERRAGPSLDRSLSLLPPDRLEAILKGEDDRAAVWVLKYLGESCPARVLASLVLDRDEERGASFLHGYVLCNPDLTSLSVRAAMARRIFNHLDREERALIDDAAEAASDRSSFDDPFETAAYVLNSLPEKICRHLLERLEIHHGDVYAELRNRIFFYEDILLLDDRSFQRLLRELDMDVLIRSQSGSESYLEEIRGKLETNMSRRAWSMLKEEQEFRGGVDEQDIWKSREEVVRILATLERNGDIRIKK